MSFEHTYHKQLDDISVNYALEQRVQADLFQPVWHQRVRQAGSGLLRYAVAPGGVIVLIGCLISPAMAEATGKVISDSASAVQQTTGKLIQHISVAFDPEQHTVDDTTLSNWNDALATDPALENVNLEYDRSGTGESLSVTDSTTSEDPGQPYKLTSPDGKTVIQGGVTEDGKKQLSITSPYTEGEVIQGEATEGGESTFGWDTAPDGSMTTTTSITSDDAAALHLEQTKDSTVLAPTDSVPADQDLEAQAAE